MKKMSILSVAAALVIAGTATAGQTTVTLSDLQVLSGTPTVDITYTNANGTGSITENGVYAGPQVNGGVTNSPVYYCVDLWHDNGIGSTYSLVTPPIPSITFPNSSYANVDNTIGWMLTQDQSTPDSRAAVQLAIWYAIDSPGVNNGNDINFSFTGGDATVVTDYNKLIAGTGIDGGANYGPSETYSATFYQALSANQNLVTGGSFGTESVPEPSSLILGAISALALAGFYGWRRIA
jgi:hypothetical protein